MTRALRLLLLSMVAAAVPCAGLGRARPATAGACAAALLVALLGPHLFRRLGLELSAGLELAWLLPFALAWGLGEGMDLYARLPCWDHVAHAAGGAMAFALSRAWVQPRLRAGRLSLAALCVMAALAVGALWELGEFASDSWLRTATQSGNTDTMLDLAFDLAGATGAALARLAGELAGAVHFRSLPLRGRGA